jgi:hypothetical protein
MTKQPLATLSSLAFILLFTACSKNSVDRCPEISASVTTPVEAGGTIELTAPDYEDVQFYHWTGPHGFESTEQNPVINNVQGHYAGRYTLEVGIINGCTRTTQTDSVVITVPASPCNPGNNTGTLDGQSMSFYSVTGGAAGGSYFIDAVGSQGDIEIEFPGTGKPAPGMYNIEPLSGTWIYGAVRVRFVANSSNWPASSGKLYVSVNNNKVTATFCTVPVFNQTFSYAATGSARLTEK